MNFQAEPEPSEESQGVEEEAVEEN